MTDPHHDPVASSVRSEAEAARGEETVAALVEERDRLGRVAGEVIVDLLDVFVGRVGMTATPHAHVLEAIDDRRATWANLAADGAEASAACAAVAAFYEGAARMIREDALAIEPLDLRSALRTARAHLDELAHAGSLGERATIHARALAEIDAVLDDDPYTCGEASCPGCAIADAQAEPLYFVRNASGRFDELLWWGPDHCGYTTRLEEAGRYTEDAARTIERESERGDRAFPVEMIEALAERVVPRRVLRELEREEAGRG